MKTNQNVRYTIEERAKKHYGITTVPEFAGYMLPDGKMLNFSDGGYQRDQDHRNISYFYKTKDGDGCFGTYMYKFMRRGNIRCSCNECCYGFEFSKLPTKEQWITLRDIHRDAEEMGKSFIIEKKMPNGIKTFDFDEFSLYLENHADYYLY
jgi:hypothetical protein